MRCAIAAAEQNKQDEFIETVFRAYWERTEDIAKEDVIRALAAEVDGLDADLLITRGNSEDMRAELARSTQEGLDKGEYRRSNSNCECECERESLK